MTNRTTMLRVLTLICAVTLCWSYPADAWFGKKKKAKPKAEPAQALQQPAKPTPYAKGVKLAMAKQWDAAIAKLEAETDAERRRSAERCLFAVQALQAYEQGRYGEAVKLFAQAAKRADGFASDALWLNAACQDGADPQPLLAYCDANASAKSALKYKAKVLAALGRVEESQAVYAQLAKAVEQEYEAAGRPAAKLRQLADLYEAAGDVEGASTIYEGSTQDAETPEPFIELAVFWQRQGKSARAKGCMEMAIELCDRTDVIKLRKLRSMRDGNWDERGRPFVSANPERPAPLAVDNSTVSRWVSGTGPVSDLGDEGARDSKLDSGAVPLPPVPAKTLEHTVATGETLEMISLMYDTTVSAIQAANPNIKGDADLRPNLRIRVPYE